MPISYPTTRLSPPLVGSDGWQPHSAPTERGPIFQGEAPDETKI